MPEFILLMHADSITDDDSDWEPYLRKLRQVGVFEGGSPIGGGVCVRKSGSPAPLTSDVVGYIRVSAESLDEAQSLVTGNPVFEAGGTIEVRELPRTD
jgi:hypothetical protein